MPKKTKPEKRTKPEPTPEKAKPEPMDFDQRVIAFLNVILRMVQEQRTRTSGAIKFGRDGMHVLLVEAADTAMRAGPNGYLSAATYAVVAAMMSAEQWDDPKPPEPKADKKPRPKRKKEAPTK